jgi:hypothetical protein
MSRWEIARRRRFPRPLGDNSSDTEWRQMEWLAEENRPLPRLYNSYDAARAAFIATGSDYAYSQMLEMVDA